MFMKQSRPDDQTSQMTPGTTSKLYTFVLKVSENLLENREDTFENIRKLYRFRVKIKFP